MNKLTYCTLRRSEQLSKVKGRIADSRMRMDSSDLNPQSLAQ